MLYLKHIGVYILNLGFCSSVLEKKMEAAKIVALVFMSILCVGIVFSGIVVVVYILGEVFNCDCLRLKQRAGPPQAAAAQIHLEKADGDMLIFGAAEDCGDGGGGCDD